MSASPARRADRARRARAASELIRRHSEEFEALLEIEREHDRRITEARRSVAVPEPVPAPPPEVVRAGVAAAKAALAAAPKVEVS